MGKIPTLTLSDRGRTGAFVVVSIDPVASMGDLQNDAVTALCKEITPKKYIAYVDMSCPETSTGTPSPGYHTYHFFFAYQGLSFLVDAQGSQMDTPIFPNTIHESRAPVNPSKPFPWDECYLSIFPSVKARVARRLVGHEDATVLSEEERLRLDMFMREVRARRPDLLASPTMASFEFPDQDGLDGEDEPTPGKLKSERDTAPPRVPVLTWSYDLLEAERVTDPMEFLEELEVLDRLRAEHTTQTLSGAE